ncbi:MAG TPA: cysteine desulfurase [Chryseolinea sp.]
MNSTTLVSSFNSQVIREEFPLLDQKVNGCPLIYFDNAATTQKPRCVIDALTNYYQQYNSNIHRGIHTLAEKATKDFELTRETARQFIHADAVEEIIFVRGVTEAINLVASSYGMSFINEGDEIVVSGMEHHSNLVPWQWVCERRNAVLKIAPFNDNGELDLEEYEKLLSPRTKLVAINHASNSLGTINPLKEIIQLAHAVGAVVLADGAQSGAHVAIDVSDLDCDFYCLSAHKMYGPTGVGILYGKKALLEKMPPYQGGGEMIREVSYQRTTFNDLPYKFEAGTPNIADVIAFRRALEFINDIGKENIAIHESELLHYASAQVEDLTDVKLVGTAREKVGVLSFVVKDIHPFDIGQLLDANGIAVRTGHHCTQPLMARLGINGTVRASFAMYNTESEIDRFVVSLRKVINLLK